jgi:hypothetical protein
MVETSSDEVQGDSEKHVVELLISSGFEHIHEGSGTHLIASTGDDDLSTVTTHWVLPHWPYPLDEELSSLIRLEKVNPQTL